MLRWSASGGAPMRLELHLFLWVTAGLAVLVQLSGGLRLPAQIPFDGVSVRAQLADANGQSADEKVDIHSLEGRIGAADYDYAIRPMFTVIAAPEIQPAIVTLSETASPPELKGMLGGDDGRRAVFSNKPGTAEVVIVSAGAEVAGYRIELVGEDFVLATAPTGDEVRFELRGAGEGN